MARFLGIAPDMTAGGSTYDSLTPEPVVFPTPTEYYPVSTANVAKGLQTLDRNDEVRGVRGNSPIVSFAAQPQLTFESRAYPPVVKRLLRAALGGAVSTTGTSPAPIISTWEPISSGQNLPALAATVIRDGQRDRLTGLALNTTTFTFPVEGEGTVSAEMWALYHEVDASPTSGLPTPSYAGSVDTFKLRDAVVYGSDGTVKLVDVSGFSLTFDNGLYSDFESRFSAGENVRPVVVNGVSSRVWYPKRNKVGPQQVTGTINFGVVRPDQDLLALITRAQKVVFQVGGGPAGTTPPSKETLQITMYNVVLSGDGAGALTRENDIRSQYSYTAYVDPTVGKDITVQYAAAAAVS